MLDLDRILKNLEEKARRQSDALEDTRNHIEAVKALKKQASQAK